MFYRKDFLYSNRNIVPGNLQYLSKPVRYEKDVDKKEGKETGNAIGSFFKMYLLRSSMHGMRYLVEDEMKTFERLIWLIIVIISISTAAYTGILLANRFYSSPLQTVVESTIFNINNIFYPAVTICNNNRVDWSKIEEGKKKFIPNSTKEVEALFESFVAKMEILEWANWDNYAPLRNTSLAPLDHINFLELNDFFTHSCEEMFEQECWFRYRYFPCCEIFVKQKSEYGFCYAYNSVVNDIGLAKWLANEQDWPKSTSTFGDWSGLRLNLLARLKSKVPDSVNPVGVTVIVHYPFAWPNSAIFVPAGSSAAVALKPKLSYAVQNTRRYDPISRDCLFADEAKNPKYMNLPGLEYHMTNCISACRQRYMVAKCNCSLESMFPIGNYQPCKLSSFHCLFDNNDLFNFENHVKLEKKADTNQTSMFCPCLHECSSLDYQTEIVPMPLAKENFSEEMILLDIHFQHETLIKYRTEVVYEWLDLLVAFGGIAGLFVGASLVSGVEFFYYFTIGLCVYMRDRVMKVKKANMSKIVPVYPKNFSNEFQRRFSFMKH